MKNLSASRFSKFRESYIKKISKKDFDYELPAMVVVVVLSVVLMLTIMI